MNDSTAGKPQASEFVHWFRSSAPYINAHRGRTFVIAFGGEVVADSNFPCLIHDIALLNSLGVRLVLVHGARPQIEKRLRERSITVRYVKDLRITDEATLVCVKEAVGALRVEIEALLSMGLANSPMAGARIRVASSNFVTARPLGIRAGIDYQHTGEVRRIDVDGIRERLESGAIVLLSPLGYSPTGEVFNLSGEDVAVAVANSLQADKLVFLAQDPGVLDATQGLLRELTPHAAEQVLHSQSQCPEETVRHLAKAVLACRSGVHRVHLISRHIDGALLLELFTRDGIGTLVTSEPYEETRQATIDDVGGILKLITPLEAEGILVQRSREQLEIEIERFAVIERDRMIIGSAALYPFSDVALGELACLAVHSDYRNASRGEALLRFTERHARALGLRQLVVLSTRAAHWFLERGFQPADIADLPVERRVLYNYQRNSKVFIKVL
jgi:amino-acid N-acetyltransferase